MIKYLGSKRRLVPLITALATSCGAKSALDLFSGTARVAMAMKEAGIDVTAVDSATYAHVLAQSYIATDARTVDEAELAAAVDALNRLPGRKGYVTEVFCEKARYFHPQNGERIDAIRQAIDDLYGESALRPLLLTSLLEAADRVDSTTGLQMAYLKSWAPRALRPLELRAPALLNGPGAALLGDVTECTASLGHFDVAYLDPPYNQHRYFTNYHVWETLIRWDAPQHYGVACKRIDAREKSTASAFNRKREMPRALEAVISATDADLVILSYNDESWLGLSDLVALCGRALSRPARPGGPSFVDVALIGVDQPRYVGARIGIHSPSGEKVGTISHLRNTEWIVVLGAAEQLDLAVKKALDAAELHGLSARLIAVGGPDVRAVPSLVQ